jgi:hypothetical protein
MSPPSEAREVRPGLILVELLAVDGAGAPRRIHRRGVGRAAHVDRREPGVVDQPGDDALGLLVVAAHEHDDSIGPGAPCRLLLKDGGQGVEGLRVARSRHPRRVDLGRGAPAEVLPAVAAELVRGVDDDFPVEGAGLRERLVDEQPRRREHDHLAELDRLARRARLAADLGGELPQPCLIAGLERPNGMTMLGTVLAEEHETPELLALYRERLVAPGRRELRAVLRAARDRGEIRRDANFDVAVTALVGAFFARYLAGDSLGGRFVAQVVDTVLDGLRP